MKVNWFSPIEPARTGIAQYTNMIVPWLARYAEVRVWTTQKQYDKSLAKHAEVREYRSDALPWLDLNQAELTFFNMGNHVGFHLDVWLASMQYPGIVILHDVFYKDFFNGVREKVRMGALPGHLGLEQGSLQAVLQKATAALLHSPAEFDRLAPTLNRPAILTALPYEPASDGTVREWTKLRDSRRARRRLIVFGYLNANRRVTSILEVLAKYRSSFELQLCGQLSDPAPIEEKIRALGLQDSVTVTGYVEALDRALAQADLAINLRNPTMGEASGSQLRIWDHALPSIVTKIGWYARLPEDAVRFVRPDAEQEDLAAHLEAYLADPDQFAAIGANGRRTLLADHSPDDYARGLLSLESHARTFQCGAAAQALGARVTADLKRWFDPGCKGFTDRVAQEIGEILA